METQEVQTGLELKILNLSSHVLSEGEQSLLLKGLKFTPTPHPNPLELQTDVQKFNRKLLED